jgi:hypothetical protein
MTKRSVSIVYSFIRAWSQSGTPLSQIIIEYRALFSAHIQLKANFDTLSALDTRDMEPMDVLSHKSDEGDFDMEEAPVAGLSTQHTANPSMCAQDIFGLKHRLILFVYLALRPPCLKNPRRTRKRPILRQHHLKDREAAEYQHRRRHPPLRFLVSRLYNLATIMRCIWTAKDTVQAHLCRLAPHRYAFDV